MDSHTEVDSNKEASLPSHTPAGPAASYNEKYPATQVILARHSTRAFDPSRTVPLELLEECFSLSQTSPSSTNYQPWRLWVVSGPRLDSLKTSLTEAVRSGVKSSIPPTPESFRHMRSEMGHELYGPRGYDIPRSDKEGAERARLRNYSFFDAPLVAAICIPTELANEGRLSDIFSVGLYAQTLTLLLGERGLGSCLQVAPTGYQDILKKEMGITEKVEVISTLAIGYEDDVSRINHLRVHREEWKSVVKFVE